MFEVGWSEMLVIAVVMIVVVGPKDLPRMLRQFGRTTAKLRAMAGDFRRQFDEALKDAELDDVKQSIDQIRGFDPRTTVRKHLTPFEQAAQDVRSGVDNVMKPKPAQPGPASTEAQAVEPLKTGAVERPASEQPVTPAAEPAAPASLVPTAMQPADVADRVQESEAVAVAPAAPAVSTEIEPAPNVPAPKHEEART
ncbi:MAG: twin-arginine translocase subunit TatB [Methylobacterium mesophilicum]|nr:twin-arginine translocase subunit TatB [Methylobacterium mesophilicum]